MIDNENLMFYSLFTAVKKLNNSGHLVDCFLIFQNGRQC